MELWQLRTFCVVAKTLHFRRAAEELYLSQPAVSHQIKALEEEIEEPLFLREKDGVKLTQAGETMYLHAVKILDIADEIHTEIRENKDVLSGKIVLGYVTRGLGNPFALHYENFKENYRDIDLFFQNEYRLENIVEKVKKGEIDIGVVSHNLDHSGLTMIPFGEYEMILVVGKNHRLAGENEVTAADLADEEWILFEPENRLRESSDEFMKKAGIAPQNIFETNDGSLIRSMVVNSNKISMLPEWGVFEELKDQKIFRLKIKDVDCKLRICLIWKASRRTKTMSAVITYLLEKQMEGFTLDRLPEKPIL
jgi:DNA-binding transcriptional LysR family regulator